MGTKLKRILIDKILPKISDRTVLFRNLKTVNVAYKHNSNHFVVNLSQSFQNVENDKDNNIIENALKNNAGSTQISIDREVFIKNVLKEITCMKPKEDLHQKVVIDFSSPNIAKPFHAGHLRSTIIGNFISNINRFFNNTVTKINYLGDWGTQFGLLQYGLRAKNIDINQLKTDPIKSLYDVYVYANKLSLSDESVQKQARKYFADIEQGKTDLQNWKSIRDVTVQELQKVYRRLGIQFDEYHWESDYNGGAIKDIINFLEKESIIHTDEEGKKIAKIKDKDVTVLKSDNSTLYLSRDIAALLDRYKRYKFNKMLYVVDNAQTDHFAAVFEIVRKINKDCADGCQHIKFGRIKGMSTRSGNVVFLSDILDEAKRKMHEQQSKSKNTRQAAMNDETCDILGTTAVIINDLKQRRQKDYTFNWEKTLQSEGDSGIKLQYLHCRLWSLEQNCGVSVPNVCEPKYLPEEVVGDVVAELAKFEDVLYKSLTEYEACILVNYLFRLAKHVNRMFKELKVKNVNKELAEQRLLVFHSARCVVKTGLELLGIRPLYEM